MPSIQYGDKKKGFCKLENNLGVPLAPAAGDAFKARAIELGPDNVNREAANDEGLRGTKGRIQTSRRGRWRTQVLWRSSGSLGVIPDIDPFLVLAFGKKTVNVGVDVVYSQLDDREGNHASIWNKLSDIVEFVRGAICQTLTIEWTGNGLILLDFAGIAVDYGKTGETTASGAGAGITTLTVADLDFLAEHSLIQVGSDDNSGAGFFLTGLDHALEQGTLSANGTWADTDVVKPFMPTPIYTDVKPIYGAKVSTSLDGGATIQKALGGRITINTGLDLLDETEGSEVPTDVIVSGGWSVVGETRLLLRKEDVHLYSHAARQIVKDLRISLGSKDTEILQIDMNQVEFDPVPADIADNGPARITLPWEAKQSAGEDQITATQK